MKRTRIPTIGSLLLVVCPAVGLAGGGVVAVQTADPSCGDDSGNIYVDCGNGTVTDNRTGLVWLENADCLYLNWHAAMEFVAGLSDMPAASAAAAHDCGLSDGSSRGEWRLPSVAELEAMVADALSLGCTSPPITNDQGTGCWSSGCNTAGDCSFSGVNPAYWSSSSDVTSPNSAWTLVGPNADPWLTFPKANTFTSVWAVRSGQ